VLVIAMSVPNEMKPSDTNLDVVRIQCVDVKEYEVENESANKQSVLFQDFPKINKGRKSVVNEFPNIIQCIEEMLITNGLAADERRKKGIQYYGTLLDMIVDHLLNVIPGLRDKHPKLNATTIAHLMSPPRLGSTASRSYLSIIDARPYHNENSHRITTHRAHSCAAYVKFFSQLFVSDKEDVIIMSADKKNLLILGTDPCVSRYNKKRAYFKTGMRPQSNIHDFDHPLKIAC